MPIHKVAGGWQYGTHGKVYPNRTGAVKQAIAIHASGYKEKGGGAELSHEQKMELIRKARDKSRKT